MAAPTAVRFDAIGQGPAVAISGLADGFTIAGWVYRVVDTDDYAAVFWVADSADGVPSAYLGTNSSGDTLNLDIDSGGAGAAGPNLVTPKWFFVAMCHGSGTTTVTGWWADLDDPSLTAFDPTASGALTGVNQVQIGDNYYDEFWNGRIQGVKLWDHILTESELEDERTQLDPVKTSGIISSWRLASPTDTTDYSGSNTLPAMTGASTEAGSGIENVAGGGDYGKRIDIDNRQFVKIVR